MPCSEPRRRVAWPLLVSLAFPLGCASGGDGAVRDAGPGGGLDAATERADAGALDAPGTAEDAPASDDAAILGDDAHLPGLDAFSPVPNDAHVAPPDAWAPDASTRADAWAPDAHVSPDAYAPPDAYSPPDAWAPDAHVPPDAYSPPDAWVPGCALPTNACADGTESRDRCSGARVIGRRTASATGGYSVTADTCSASNRFDDCSWDAGNDHAYRIWLRAGERVSARITSRLATCFESPAITLKLYESTGCSDVTCSGDRWCHDFVSNGETHTHTAARDGWIVIVVDGSTAFDDEGRYTLNVTLAGCAAAACECP
jgi:hypothetical protein